MSIVELYRDYGIETAPERHRHSRDGWLNVRCPHCTGSDGFHLGFNIDSKFYYCYRCGSHSVVHTLSKLLQISYERAVSVSEDYRVTEATPGRTPNKQANTRVAIHPLKMPSNTGPLMFQHKKYLTLRGFDPDYISKIFKLLATGPGSFLYDPEKHRKIDYSFRIVAPIYWDGEVVSFQARDHTGHAGDLRYLACPMARERVHHKHILYHSNKSPSTSAILVEGITDVWRFGHAGFGTFGTSYTQQQVRLMAKMFERLFIAFDPERPAQKRAAQLRDELMFRGVKSIEIIQLQQDPGDMPQQEADYLLQHYKLL